MDEKDEIRKGRHCVFNLKAHLVFVTKYRYRVFSGRHLDRMEDVMRSVCRDFDADLIEFNGEADHVHLIVDYPPKVALASLVNSLKGVSSRMLRKEFPDLADRYWGKSRLWSPSYFAGSCGGVTVERLRKYVENQNRPD